MSEQSNRVENWKKKLLELSKRNKMLNYRPKTVASVKIDCDDKIIYDMIFDEKPIQSDIIVKPKLTDNREENLKIKDSVNKSFRAIKKAIKNDADNYGYNTGFLAYNFLEWTEVDYSDIKIKSPILLIPITIEQESILAPFKISYNPGGEIAINPVIVENLKQQFGIDLYKKIADIDFSTIDGIREALDIFEKIASEQLNWGIKNETYLDTFKFVNMAIINDLESNNDLIKENIFSNALVNGEQLQCDWESDIELDDRPSKESVLILDADSSQQEAIMRARMGESFVIQGPPGTGKSQTIANIIAESMYYGKKFFLSPKNKPPLIWYTKSYDVHNSRNFA